MKNIFFLFAFFLIAPFAKSQSQVVVSVVTEFEGKVIKIYSDTLNTRIVYNLTGYESVGYAVLNVIALYDDGTESRKEFKVLEYKTKQNITEVLVETEQGEMKHVFMHDQNILISQDKKGSIMWEGDIIF
jgi:hypothetical protein